MSPLAGSKDQFTWKTPPPFGRTLIKRVRGQRHPTFQAHVAIDADHSIMRILTLVCLSALSLNSCSPPTPDGREIFREAQAALQEVSAVSYQFEYRATMIQGARMLIGKAVIQRLDVSGSNYRARVAGTFETQDSAEDAKTIVDVRQEHDLYSLDEAAGVVWHSSLYAAGDALLYQSGPALMYPFFDPRSLDGEISALDVTWQGLSDVHGEPCDLVRVSYADDDEDSLWCFGTDDHLPRRLEWISADGSEDLRIFRLATEPAIDDRTFSMETPPGLTVKEKIYGPEPGSPAEDWTLATPAGEIISLSDLVGQVVVLDFWATWCPPCIASLEGLRSIEEELQGRPVRYFAVNTMESGDPVAFADKHGLDLTILLEGDTVHDRYALGSLPASVVIDPTGRHVGLTLGYFGEGSERYLRQLIEKALVADAIDPITADS
jgi:thiol-disulfide isomerase/thioredoxin